MELLIGGLAIGSVYALLAIGIVLVHRASGVVNFAQGELMMVSAFAYAVVSERVDSPLLQVAAALAAGALGGLLCFAVVHLLLPRSSKLAQVIGTLAVLILLQAGARYLFTDTPRRAEPWIFGERNLDILGVNLPVNSAVILAVQG